MPYSPPGQAWITLRSHDALEQAMRRAEIGASELAARAGTSRQNIHNLRRSRSGRIREDIGARIERALGLSRGELFDYEDPSVLDTGPARMGRSRAVTA